MREMIGKYKLLKVLGEGATGSVYLADDPFSERDVAIKVMNEKAIGDPEELRRQQRFFQTESSLAGKLRHPHIVRILDAGVDAGARYLVMEYVEGTTLQPHCEPANRLPIPRVIEIAYKCCKALEYANQAGVVHRDIKPANVMLRRDDDIKISDFGAAMFDRADVTQVTGVGSPAYMSPEQVQGATLNFQTDIFSLGAMCYHLLAGRKPFPGPAAIVLMHQIIEVDPAPPSSFAEEVPRELDAIIARAMAKDREQRYGSWDAFATDLEKLLVLDGGSGSGLSEAEKFSAMRRLPFFKGFSDVELWEVVRRSTWRKYDSGENLITEGDTEQNFFVLASGLARISSSGRTLNAVFPGECIGEMACARRNGQPRTATVSALEPSWTIGMRVADLDDFSAGCRARFNEAFLSIMAERISMLSGRLLHALHAQKIGMV